MATNKKKRSRKHTVATCSVPRCGRTLYASGYCQTHHRQVISTGRVAPIRPYRARSEDTIKIAGLRLSPDCAETLKEYAEGNGLSYGAVIAEVLERWHSRRPS